ncbi:MAG: ATP-binding protein [bacterium]
MKTTNIKIGTKLILAMGAMLFFVFLIGALAYIQVDKLWRSTVDLYNHPLHISRSTRDINIEIFFMENQVNKILNTNLSEDEFFTIEKSIQFSRQKINNSFSVVYNRYLGDKATIDSAFTAYKLWNFEIDKMLTFKENNIKFKYGNEQLLHNTVVQNKLLKNIQTMVLFAKAKSDLFFANAKNQKEIVSIWGFIIIFISLLASFGISIYLIKSIKKPLQHFIAVANEYKKGNHNIRFVYKSNNEFGKVALAFNEMAETIQKEFIVKEDTVHISNLLFQENELKPFCQVLLNSLTSTTSSQCAAIYFLDSEKILFEHYLSIGLLLENIKSFSANSFEGEFGKVLATKEINYITHIPEDTVFVFSSVVGKFKPKAIITIPIVHNNEVLAIISLASLTEYSSTSIQLINNIFATLTARISGALAFQKVQDYSAQLNKQNTELSEKSTELMMQSEELKEYNIELELQKRQLDKANQLKTTFLSNMSHELRTPLNSVIALSGVLLRKLNGIVTDDEINYIRIIEKNGKSLLDLINDLLDLSRIEAGKEDIYYTKFSITEIVESLIDTLTPIANEKNIELNYSITDILPEIISDSNKCYHILQNVISNAVKFTDIGSVHINLRRRDEDVIISIKDTGIGISEEKIPYIFDEFRQGDERTSRKYGGSGLGLAIAKKYLSLLQGEIDVITEPEKGTEFIIYLPIEPKINYELNEEIRFTEAISLISDNNSIKDKTILIVEDSEPAIIQLKEILSKEGVNVRIAKNGIEALSEIKKEKPNAVILDLMMPELDGFEVLSNIRNVFGNDKLPVLILTAKHITKEELKFLKGNNIYQLIQKGDINKNDLLKHIKNMLNN